jgi:hypothetical protein
VEGARCCVRRRNGASAGCSASTRDMTSLSPRWSHQAFGRL